MKLSGWFFTVSLFLAVFILAPPGARSDSKVDFLLPGLTLEGLSLREGAAVGYLVVTEAFGVMDSTGGSMEVKRAGDGRVEVHIVTSRIPPDEESTLSVIIRFPEGIEGVESTDELRSSIDEILLKTGSEPYRHPTDEELKEFGLDEVFVERNRELKAAVLDSETVSTPAGTFQCSVTAYSGTKRKKVDLGGISAERVEESRVTLWRSGGVPVFGLVKSRLETRKQTVPQGSKDFPLSRPRTTITEAHLIYMKTVH